MASEQYVQTTDIETLHKSEAWTATATMYQKNRTSKKILGDLLLESQKRTEKDVLDDEAWPLQSVAQATLESVEFHDKKNHFR